MNDGPTSSTNPGFDVLLGITREIGEHAGRIAAAEGNIKQAVVAVQDATKEMQFFRSRVPTSDDCDDKHNAVAERVVNELRPLIAANGNGATAAGRKHSGWYPKNVGDLLGWLKLLAIIGGLIWALVLSGAWLSDRGLLSGDGRIGGIEVTAHPESTDPLREDLRLLLEHLKKSEHGPTSAGGEPDWHRMGLDKAVAEVEGG